MINLPTRGKQKTVDRVDIAKRGRDRFDELCKTAAKEVIYRKIENVEGVALTKIRPSRGDKDLANRFWPGAAFAQEFREDEYIKSFMWYEHSSSPKGDPVTKENRGYLNSTLSDLPGYQFVDVPDGNDKTIYRYHLVRKPRDGSVTDAMDTILEKTIAPSSSARYAVTFEDHVIPQERELWIASSTVKVIDTQTNEVLGETTRYALAAGDANPSNPVPWLSARQCPRSSGAFARTRQFVDQILIPKKGT